VGALRALAEILDVRRSPFGIVTGLSAGALNCMAVGVGSDDFPGAVARLAEHWNALEPGDVYRTDTRTLVRHGLRWLKDVSTGGLLGPSRVNHLLDTAPLRVLLNRELAMHRLRDHFHSGLLRGVAVSATNYMTGSTVTFFDGAPDIEPWVRRGRVAIRERLHVEHVLASGAIPMFFPPVQIDGRFYGDGCIRMTTPLAPAIHLGAKKILAIGIRHPRAPQSTVSMNVIHRAGPLPISAIAGVLLNAVFLDSLDNDVERLERINRTLSVMSTVAYGRLIDPLRRIPVLALRPSRDLGELAADQYARFPMMLRYLLRGIGATDATGWDLLSYLAFQREYAGKLMKLGYDDTRARRADIEAFFRTAVDEIPLPSVSEPPATD
jgi:NTE family protein